MSKDKLLVVEVNGEKKAVIPVVAADMKICQSCGYENGGICLRKPNIFPQIKGVKIFRNCVV